jgi:two-component system phosphate regulon sensor histidine kinase PhoR
MLILILILVFTFKTIKDYYIDTLCDNLNNIAIILHSEIITFLKDNKSHELDNFVKNIAKQINIRITVIDTHGMVVVDSENIPSLMENYKNRPEIMQALTGIPAKVLRFSTTINEEMLYIALPIKLQDKITGVLRVGLFMEHINILSEELKTEIIQLVLIMIFISLFITLILSYRLTKPVKELSSALRKVARGNFDTRMSLKTKHELKDLADSFNIMTEKIKTLLDELTLKKEELSSIISSIQIGFLVLDEKGKIVLSNESFQKFIKDTVLENKFYWEVLTLKSSKLAELIKTTKEVNKNYNLEIEIEDKIFLCNITPLKSGKRIVVVLHDITGFKRLDRIKKDFVVNVSHELRTPLTAIKGYVETLEDEVEDSHKYYLEVIKRHTERLINIVHDLLLLSELEDDQIKLELNKINLNKLIKDVLKVFEQRAKEENIILKSQVGDNITLYADTFMIEQMFINLIDNAIKYTDKGVVEIIITHENKHVVIQIKDTGIGIPREHIARIFERFYVVDKSRSRKLGGTGLGLAIVKHIVFIHHGKIDVESTQGVGTRFTITLPISQEIL